MARQKKFESVQVKETTNEVSMSQEKELDNLQSELDKTRLELENTKREIEEKKHEISSISRRDLDKKEVEVMEKQVNVSNSRKILSEKIAKQKEEDNVQVRGKFMNRRAPGQSVKLAYIKYEDDPVKWYDLQDGKVYTIPRGFAEQLNDYYHTPHFTQKHTEMDPHAPSSSIHNVDTSNKKYAFVPIDF